MKGKLFKWWYFSLDGGILFCGCHWSSITKRPPKQRWIRHPTNSISPIAFSSRFAKPKIMSQGAIDDSIQAVIIPGVEKGTGRRNTDNAGIIRLWPCLKWKEEQTCCQGRAWREWAPFSWRSGERSWHDFAAAKDQSPRTTTQHVLRCRFQSQDLLVSQWHSLPQGTGTFPTAYLGANSLCVRCVAMLPLPSKLSNYKMRDLPAQNIDKSDDSQ